MNYRVVMQPRAWVQLDEQYRYIAARNIAAANRWYNRFLEAVDGLSAFPERCAIVADSQKAGREIRELIVGKRSGARRVYFTIEQATVRILAIHHSAQAEPSPPRCGLE